MFNSAVKAMAWSPNYEGVLATGGGQDDNVIRIWDFKKGKEDQHTIRCNSEVTSLQWRKTKLKSKQEVVVEDLNRTFCEELISTHGGYSNEVKLWQINKY